MKKQQIAAAACLVAGAIGFAAVYSTQKPGKDEPLFQYHRHKHPHKGKSTFARKKSESGTLFAGVHKEERRIRVQN